MFSDGAHFTMMVQKQLSKDKNNQVGCGTHLGSRSVDWARYFSAPSSGYACDSLGRGGGFITVLHWSFQDLHPYNLKTVQTTWFSQQVKTSAIITSEKEKEISSSPDLGQQLHHLLLSSDNRWYKTIWPAGLGGGGEEGWWGKGGKQVEGGLGNISKSHQESTACILRVLDPPRTHIHCCLQS